MIPLLVLLLAAAPAAAQELTYRGFAQVQSAVYPETTPQDDERISAQGRLRFEPALRMASWITLEGSIEARGDNLELVDREWRLDTRDRGVRRPALSLRHADLRLRPGKLTVDLGKQFIRWGKADILNPTDRLAPRDFIEVTDDEFLAVTAARAQYEQGGHLLDIVWVPVFTPSRVPLEGNRWSPPLPATFGGVSILDAGSIFPRRPQYGARWNVRQTRFEMSLSYFNGFNHLPQFAARAVSEQPIVALQRTYAPLRMAGADAAVPLRWFAIKGEAAWLSARDAIADDVVLYVIQLERQSGELSLVGGYAGEVVTRPRSTFDFAPDRGLTRAFLGRAGYTLGPRSELSFETAVRQDLDGVWIKAQYSKAVAAHWRWTVGGVVIGGRSSDFIGQYRRNSHVLATLRYSF